MVGMTRGTGSCSCQSLGNDKSGEAAPGRGRDTMGGPKVTLQHREGLGECNNVSFNKSINLINVSSAPRQVSEKLCSGVVPSGVWKKALWAELLMSSHTALGGSWA